MKVKYLLGILLLYLNVIGFVSCNTSSRYVFHYVGLDEFNGDTLYLWRTTADRLKSDKDYGRKALASKVIRNGRVTFTGLIDTLHLYNVEGKNCNTYFYPEAGDITCKYLEGMEYSNPQSLAKHYEFLKSKGFPIDESRRFIFENLKNALGVYLLDYIGCYPDELNKIFENSNPAMRDTVSLFLSLKKQLSETKELNVGDMYFDFKQKGLEEDSIYFSSYFNGNKKVCLSFANGDYNSCLLKIEEIKTTYNDVCFIGSLKRYTSNKMDINVLRKKYNIHLFDDRGYYEKSTMYKYRVNYRTKMNYYLVFDEKGYLLKMYIN